MPSSPESRKSRLLGFTRSASGSRLRKAAIMRSARRTIVALSARRRKSFRTSGSWRALDHQLVGLVQQAVQRLAEAGAGDLAAQVADLAPQPRR